MCFLLPSRTLLPTLSCFADNVKGSGVCIGIFLVRRANKTLFSNTQTRAQSKNNKRKRKRKLYNKPIQPPFPPNNVAATRELTKALLCFLSFSLEDNLVSCAPSQNEICLPAGDSQKKNKRNVFSPRLALSTLSFLGKGDSVVEICVVPRTSKQGISLVLRIRFKNLILKFFGGKKKKKKVLLSGSDPFYLSKNLRRRRHGEVSAQTSQKSQNRVLEKKKVAYRAPAAQAAPTNAVPFYGNIF